MATKAIDARARNRNRGSASSRRIRKIFGNIHEISEMPNLIEVQRESYEQFLRSDPKTGYVSGLEKTLRSVFPIRDFAGTAELAGYDTSVNEVRCAAILRRVRQLFPQLGALNVVENWAGLRPATPNNVPLVGRGPLRNLYLNTGHGTLGWTLACGSGRALADLVSGRRPEVSFDFLA